MNQSQEIHKREILESLSVLQDMFNRPLSTASLSIYLQALQPYPINRIRKAIYTLTVNQPLKSLPTIGMIVDALRQIPPEQAPLLTEQDTPLTGEELDKEQTRIHWRVKFVYHLLGYRFLGRKPKQRHSNPEPVFVRVGPNQIADPKNIEQFDYSSNFSKFLLESKAPEWLVKESSC